MTPDLKLKAGFSRRIQRSTNNQLNPIPEREHSETLEMGDPDLKPEFVGLAELGLTKTFKDGGSVFLTAYHSGQQRSGSAGKQYLCRYHFKPGLYQC